MTDLTMSEYQQLAKRTMTVKKSKALNYATMGLVGEAGEIANKVKKRLREDANPASDEEVAKELGDVLWYVAILADILGQDLDTIAQNNIKKLASRQKRGQLKGTGDNR